MNLQLHMCYSTGMPFRCVTVQFEHWAAASVFLIALLSEPTTRITKPHLQHVQNAVAPEVKQFTSSLFVCLFVCFLGVTTLLVAFSTAP